MTSNLGFLTRRASTYLAGNWGDGELLYRFLYEDSFSDIFKDLLEATHLINGRAETCTHD